MNEYVSVIIPTYNRADKLKRAIESVLKQTHERFEIIIVDDHSRDETKSVVKNFIDERIYYIRNEENLGGSESRNVGIRNARYDYIAFLDDDDEWLPEKLEKQLKVLKKTSSIYCGVYTGFTRVKDSRIFSKHIYDKEGDLFNQLLWKNVIGSTSVIMLKKSCIVDVGGFTKNLPASQELELYLRLSRKYKFKSIPEVLVTRYYHDDEQITGNHSKKLVSKKYLYGKYQREIKSNSKLHSKYLYQLAFLEYMNSNNKQALNHLITAFKLNPFGIKYYLWYPLKEMIMFTLKN